MESNDRVRQIVAAVVGILIIVVLVLFARWTGDRIRERFLAPKPTVVTNQVVEPVIPVEPVQPVKSAAIGTTTSTIPETGPRETTYLLLGFLALAGAASKVMAKRLIQN